MSTKDLPLLARTSWPVVRSPPKKKGKGFGLFDTFSLIKDDDEKEQQNSTPPPLHERDPFLKKKILQRAGLGKSCGRLVAFI